MDLLGLSVSLLQEIFLFNEEVVYPETYYRGEYLIDIAKQVLENFDKEVFYDESRFKEIALFAKDIVMQIIIKDLGDLGISFDNFVSEKSLYTAWDETKSVLEKKWFTL